MHTVSIRYYPHRSIAPHTVAVQDLGEFDSLHDATRAAQNAASWLGVINATVWDAYGYEVETF